jgi:hypothetical protein
MKNDECTIYFATKKGKVLQSFRKGKNGWAQTSSRGIVRPCTAEQVLSHLLPPLAIGHAKVRVEPDKKIKKILKKKTMVKQNEK